MQPEFYFKTDKRIDLQNLMALYEDAGWMIYTSDPQKLSTALNNSLYVCSAWKEDMLAGLIRVVGDGHTIIFIQDVLVLSSFRRKGIGKALVNKVLQQFKTVRQITLLTDDKPESTGFYASVGFKKVQSMDVCAFMRINR